MLRVAGAASVAGSAGAALGVMRLRDEVGDESIDRIISFYRVAVPRVLEYKALEVKCETLPKYLPRVFPPMTDDEERALFEPLHEKWKGPIVEKFFELGGFYYKNG